MVEVFEVLVSEEVVWKLEIFPPEELESLPMPRVMTFLIIIMMLLFIVEPLISEPTFLIKSFHDYEPQILQR